MSVPRPDPTDLRPLTDAATCVALSVVLGSVRLLELPTGGSVSLAPVPLLLLALVHGTRRGVIAGIVAGALHALTGGTIVHPVQFLFDYGLAYAALGLAGPFGHRTARWAAVGVIVAMAARYLCLVLSGMVFFGQYAGSHAVLAYSLTYNATYTVPETLLCLLVLPTLARAWERAAGPTHRPGRNVPGPSDPPHGELPVSPRPPTTLPPPPRQLPAAGDDAPLPGFVRPTPFRRPPS